MSTESQLDTQILIRQGDISLENCQYSSVVVRLELGREDASRVEWFRKSAYVSSSPWEDSRGQDMLKWGYSGCFPQVYEICCKHAESEGASSLRSTRRFAKQHGI